MCSGKTSFYMLVFFTKILVNETMFLKNAPIFEQNSTERDIRIWFSEEGHRVEPTYILVLLESWEKMQRFRWKKTYDSLSLGISSWA